MSSFFTRLCMNLVKNLFKRGLESGGLGLGRVIWRVVGFLGGVRLLVSSSWFLVQSYRSLLARRSLQWRRASQRRWARPPKLTAAMRGGRRRWELVEGPASGTGSWLQVSSCWFVRCACLVAGGVVGLKRSLRAARLGGVVAAGRDNTTSNVVKPL